MPSNILFLHKCFIEGGGIERVHQNLAFALQSKNVNSCFYILNGADLSNQSFQLLKKNHRAYRGEPQTSFLSKLRDLFAKIKKEEICAIISATETANVAAFLCKLRFPNLNIIYTRHSALNTNEQKLPEWLVGVLYNIYSTNGVLVAVSDALRSSISSKLLLNSSKVHCIANAVVSDELYKSSIQEISTTLPKNYFVAVGRLVHEKGFDLLLSAYKKALEIEPELPPLFIVGEGIERQNLKAQATRDGIASNVTFLGFQQNPYPLIKNASAFLLSSRHEGMPTVIVEALALDTPVIAFNCPTGPSELIIDGLNGRLVRHLDITQFSLELVNYKKLPKVELGSTIHRFKYAAVATEYLSLCKDK